MSVGNPQIISHDTIRARLKRRVRWTMAIGFTGFVLALLSPLGIPKEYAPFLALGPLLFFAAIIIVQWFTKCPKCDTRMGQEMAQRIAFTFFGKTPNFCPYCGVSLDEPCP
jgi:4-hydroxybenzoate polyprenyltransferase